MTTEPEYYTPAEVAQRFRLSVDTIHRRVADGQLPAVRLGGTVRIPSSAVDAIEAAAISPTKAA